MNDFHKILAAEATILLEQSRFSDVPANQNGEKGRLNEDHLIKIIRKYLPQKMGIGTGFIRDSLAQGVAKDHQQDIIVFDALNNAPLYSSDKWSIYPLEMVYGVVEVKTTLNKREIRSILEKEGFNNSLSLRSKTVDLREDTNRCYLNVEKGQKVPLDTPRLFVFAYKSDYHNNEKGLKKLKKDLEDLVKEHDAHIHGLCVLENQWFFTQHRRGSGNDFKFQTSNKDGFLYFLHYLHKELETKKVAIADRTQYLLTLDT